MAAKDLQIIRTRAIPEQGESGISADKSGSGSGSPMAIVVRAVRRNWLYLGVAVIGSFVGAFFYSKSFVQEQVTAHLQMKPQQMPFSTTRVYSVPSPDQVAVDVTSPTVLDPVIKNYDMPSAAFLAKRLIVRGDSRANTLDLHVVMETGEDAVSVLEEVAEEVANLLSQRRTTALGEHLRFVDRMLLEADEAVQSARVNLVYMERDASASGSAQSDSAEDQALYSQQADNEFELAALDRRRLRLAGNSELIANRIVSQFFTGLRILVEERREQIESIGFGLKSTTRAATARQELLLEMDQLESLVAQLDTLEKIVAEDGIHAEAPDDGSEATSGQDSDDPVDSQTVDADSEQPESEFQLLAEFAEKAVEGFDEWESKVLEVGIERIGGFTERGERVALSSRSALMDLRERVDALVSEVMLLDADAEYIRTSQLEIEKKINAKRRLAGNSGDTEEDVAVLSAQGELREAEAVFSRLSQQRAEIEHAMECTDFPEYVTSVEAYFDAAVDRRSNRKKLFGVFAFASLVVLCAPVVFIEWKRNIPAPVDLISRRWKLPTLGLQSAGLKAATAECEQSNSDHALRMAALRIQQSLFQPGGRVVLFSGLDHEESPMNLIRGLASCLAQREESVLIIQTMPCQVEGERAQGSSRRQGVAEYLAGECNDLDSLVRNTGVMGIDFVPGGCTVTASEAMASSRLTSLVDHFREHYSMVLLNGPSTSHPADLQMLAARADGIVFTVNKQSLHGGYGEEVLGDLIELGAPILGFADQGFANSRAELTESSPVSERPTASVLAG